MKLSLDFLPELLFQEYKLLSVLQTLVEHGTTAKNTLKLVFMSLRRLPKVKEKRNLSSESIQRLIKLPSLVIQLETHSKTHLDPQLISSLNCLQLHHLYLEISLLNMVVF